MLADVAENGKEKSYKQNNICTCILEVIPGEMLKLYFLYP